MDSQELRIRRVAIDTWRESVVYLHRDCAVVRAAGSQGVQNGSISCVALVLAVGARAEHCGEAVAGALAQTFAQYGSPLKRPAFVRSLPDAVAMEATAVPEEAELAAIRRSNETGIVSRRKDDCGPYSAPCA